MPIDASEYEYAGFWVRVWAALIDSFLVLLLTQPLIGWLYGWDLEAIDYPGTATFRRVAFTIKWLLPALAAILFWRYRGATPGKMAIGARIVDAKTGAAPSLGQLIGRYLAYFVSTFPLFLGLLWVAFDRKKQGWHDKLARTVVVRNKRHGTEPVRFEGTA